MLVIGLTGGIASGKSTVARAFEQQGVPVLDADLVAREIVEPGEPGLTRIRELFGDDMLQADGRLDRAALRTRIFAQPADRARLDAALHPLIRERLSTRLRALGAPYAILMVPLLIEAGMRDMVDRVLVVDVPESVQIARVQGRDGGSATEAAAIVAAQLPRQARLAQADDVIVNAGDPSELADRVAELHRQYLKLTRRPVRRN